MAALVGRYPWKSGTCGICHMPGLRLDFPYPIARMDSVFFCVRCDGMIASHEWPATLIADYRLAWAEKRRGDDEPD